jgi:hypothetical protein
LINIIWQTELSDRNALGNETTGQSEYIDKVIFRNIEHVDYFDNKQYKTFLDNSIIIYSAPLSDIDYGLKLYLEKYNSMGFKYILFHLSNESLNHNYCYHNNAVHVFRFYYDPKINDTNITTLPLGFVTGYMNNESSINLSNKRDIIASFIGQPKHDRQALIDSMINMNNVFVHSTSQWNCPTSLSSKEVIDIYKRTIFIPCPIGNVSPDTLRLYEALEWGCIPVIKKYNGEDYYKYVFGAHPLPVVDDWDDLPDLFSKLINDNLDTLIVSINTWYNEFKTLMVGMVEEICLKIKQ